MDEAHLDERRWHPGIGDRARRRRLNTLRRPLAAGYPRMGPGTFAESKWLNRTMSRGADGRRYSVTRQEVPMESMSELGAPQFIPPEGLCDHRARLDQRRLHDRLIGDVGEPK